MTHCKKKRVGISICVVLFSAVLAGIWLYLVHDVNERFPEPVIEKTQIGERADYLGMELMGKECKLYDDAELAETFPEFAKLVQTEYDENDKYIHCIIRVQLHNRSKKTIVMEKENILYSILELDGVSNGSDYSGVEYFNENLDFQIDSKETKEYVLYYKILTTDYNKEKLMSGEKRLVYSYYPTKSYLVFD